MGDGHHLYPGARWLRLPLRGDRLAQPLRPGVGTVEHAGRLVLRSRSGPGEAVYGVPEIFNAD
jgi:hypothetical protein